MNVLLDDACTLFISSRLLNQSLDLIKIFQHSNALPSIGIFTWFNDPDVSFLRSLSKLSLLISAFTVIHKTLSLFLFTDLVFFFDIICSKARELGIFQTLLYVKSNRHSIKHILTHGFIVQSDVQEHGFLVAQVKVILKFVIQFDTELLQSL